MGGPTANDAGARSPGEVDGGERRRADAFARGGAPAAATVAVNSLRVVARGFQKGFRKGGIERRDDEHDGRGDPGARRTDSSIGQGEIGQGGR